MDITRFNILYNKYLNEVMTPQELNEWRSMMTSGEYDGEFEESLAKTANEDQSAYADANLDLSPVFERIIGPVMQRRRPAYPIHLLKTVWIRYAAAILVIAGIGGYLWNIQQNKKHNITAVQSSPVIYDVRPGGNKAVLTLSNGQKVELDSAATETIIDGALSIKNNNGGLVYSTNSPSSDTSHEARLRSSDGEAVLNTMTTPNGGQYRVVLADGTKVWLNAASSITYPVAFTGNSREVKITGEAYFEVAKNREKPFYVQTYGDRIAVVGTHFNVNAYPEEGPVKTSLLEGAVKIGEKTLRPGQGYLAGKVVKTNTGQDIAWTRGRFNFQDKKLTEIMRQLARWYDLNIEYARGTSNPEFSGDMPMHLNLSQVLRVLQGAGVQFRLKEKNTLQVFPE